MNRAEPRRREQSNPLSIWQQNAKDLEVSFVQSFTSRLVMEGGVGPGVSTSLRCRGNPSLMAAR